MQIRIISSEVNGGLGIPENIVTACPECHFEYDFGKQTNQYRLYTENYLKRIYGRNWNKEIKLLHAVFKLDRRLRAIRRAMQEGINQNLKLNEKEAEEMTKVLNKCREEIENHVITRTKTHGKGENLWT